MQESIYLDKNETMLDNLRGLDILEPFEDQELNNLLEMSKIRKYKTGEIIVREGRSDTWLYFLMRGEVMISKKGKEVVTLTRKGEIFGEMGALDSSPRSASAHAVTATVCLATDIFYIEKLTGNDKVAFGYVLYRILADLLSRRLRKTTEAFIQSKGKLNLKFW